MVTVHEGSLVAVGPVPDADRLDRGTSPSSCAERSGVAGPRTDGGPPAAAVRSAHRGEAGASARHARVGGRGRSRRVGERVAHLVLSLVLVAATGLALAVAVVPRVTGSVPLTVLTGSMRPHLQPGDLVVVRPTDPANLAVGDVVTFQPRSGDPTLITHRITAIASVDGQVASLTTQGDANGAPDAPIVPAQVMGRVWYHVPLVGRVMNLAHPMWVAVVAGGVLIGYAVRTALRPDSEVKSDPQGVVDEHVHAGGGTDG